jgi:hypothetical protein
LQFFAKSSDVFFDEIAPGTEFDVVFLDGLHTFEQTLKDLLNTLKHLQDGAILVDDVVPLDETSAIPDESVSLARRAQLGLKGRSWHGDVWKLVVCIGKYFPGLDFRTIKGPGNPQTLVWRKEPDVEITEPSAVAVGEIAALSYREVFSDGVPASFRPCAKREAQSACLTVVAPRRLAARL